MCCWIRSKNSEGQNSTYRMSNMAQEMHDVGKVVLQCQITNQHRRTGINSTNIAVKCVQQRPAKSVKTSVGQCQTVNKLRQNMAKRHDNGAVQYVIRTILADSSFKSSIFQQTVQRVLHVSVTSSTCITWYNVEAAVLINTGKQHLYY